MVKIAILLLLTVTLCSEYNIQSQPLQATSSHRNQSVKKRLPASLGDITKDQSVSLDSVKKVLWWLPENTQTISVVRGPFKAIAPISELPKRMSAIKQVDLALKMDHLGAFRTIREGRFYKHLIGRTVLFSMEGSRKFRAPTDLGEMLYEGCDVIVFQQGLGSVRDTLFKQMQNYGKLIPEIAGQQIIMFEEKLEADIWKIYVAMPEPNVLLCATDQDFLSEVLKRMQQKGQRRALPEELPEWKYVNTGAKFWSVRHYDKDDAQSDPSSPLNGEQRAANWPDTQAVGIVFDFDPIRSKVAKIKYLSANKDALQLFSKEHSTEDFKPRIQQSAPGVIEMRISFDNPEVVWMFLLILRGVLGHGMYL